VSGDYYGADLLILTSRVMKKLFWIVLSSFILLIIGSCGVSSEEKIIDDPVTLSEYRNNVGKSFMFKVKGTSSGSVWGGADGVYTDDSRLAKAAVHAGKVSIGEENVVKVTILAGRSSYTGSTKNGVTTDDWHMPWPGSFKFD
jgi:hypothetical protein